MKYEEMKRDLFLLNKNMNLIKRNDKQIERDLHQLSENITSDIYSLKKGRNLS